MEGTATAPKVFQGRTLDADAPFVGGDFWEVGKVIRGEVAKIKPSMMAGKNTLIYVIELDAPVEIDGEEWDRVSLGNLTGFQLVLQDAGIDRLFLKDQIEMECESIKKPKKEGYSPRPNFILKVTRP